MRGFLKAAAPFMLPCLVAFVVAIAFCASRTGPEGGNATLEVLRLIGSDGSVALFWWIGALGVGLALARLLRDGDTEPPASTSFDDLAVGLAVGAAVMLWLDSVLGSLGAFSSIGPAVPWILTAAGGILLVRHLGAFPLLADAAREPKGAAPWLVPVAIGAVAGLLATAAASAPGWLWSSEFGGYDALSYHLVLPKHWLEAKTAMGPVAGNVYSALPGFVESAFAHAMVLRGSAIEGAIACQFWAAIATLAAAFCVARLARALGLGGEPAVAAACFVAVPWVVVTGTLAYNDIVPCLMLAAAWLVIARARDGAAGGLGVFGCVSVALCAAAACGAKPTALFFTVIPLAVIAVVHEGPRVLRLAPIALVVALVVLAPWFARNVIAYGNPVFPFATGLFGAADWTEEQISVFANAHGPDRPFFERLPLVGREWLWHGLGEPPAKGEPWFPQWSVLPIAGLAGLALCVRRSRAAVAALGAIAAMLVAWMLLTHLKSRFLLPTAVPLALGAAALLAFASAHLHPAAMRFLAAALVAMPFVCYLREPMRGTVTHAPAALVGQLNMMTGTTIAQDFEQADQETRKRLLSQAPTPFWINYMLPDGAKVLGVGFATPFYLAPGRVEITTVWDRGAFDAVVADAPTRPESWSAALRAKGYTHLLIDPVMLSRWAASGWLNPQLSAVPWVDPIARSNRVVAGTIDGKLLIALVDAAAPVAEIPASGEPAGGLLGPKLQRP
ncbi:MAG: hypothetical protein LW636_03775 [Planctomycetaceae bacterium]|nr:hypothetical protein [Planctomycetaceae bacterium]